MSDSEDFSWDDVAVVTLQAPQSQPLSEPTETETDVEEVTFDELFPQKALPASPEKALKIK